MLNELKESTDRQLSKSGKLHLTNGNINKKIETMKKTHTEILKLNQKVHWRNSVSDLNR